MKEPITPITAILLYMFGCGSLYIIGFWSNFQIDITQFINIWDIPKSFVFPFLISAGLGIIITYIIYAVNSLYKIEIKAEASMGRNNKKYITIDDILHFFQTTVLVFLVITIILFYFLKNEYFYWQYAPIIFFLSLIFQLNKIEEIKQWNKKRAVNRTIFFLLVLTPPISFSYGKIGGMRIYNNKDIMYITAINKAMPVTIIDTTSIKYLGFLGDKLIGSTLNNDSIIVFNQADLSRVVLTKNKRLIRMKIEPKADTVKIKLPF